MFGVGVGLEHADAHVPFEDDAADGPDVAGVGPTEFWRGKEKEIDFYKGL